MLRYTDLTGVEVDKVQNSIRILQSFEPHDDPYIVLYSGGKDSDCVLELAKMAGVRFEAHYSATTVDPKELVRHIIHKHPEVIIDKPETSMRKLIPQKLMPPTRIVRYCCDKLKESNYKERVCVSGVRWAESNNRRNNQGIVTLFNGGKKTTRVADEVGAVYKINKQGGVILNTDNDEARRMVERCYRTSRTLVNPIIDWQDEDVWEFIKERNIDYCKLYDKGYNRIGCVGCPMTSLEEKLRQFKDNPSIKNIYLQGFEEMIKMRKDKGLPCLWKGADDVMHWWLYGSTGDKQIDGQIDLMEEMLVDEYE